MSRVLSKRERLALVKLNQITSAAQNWVQHVQQDVHTQTQVTNRTACKTAIYLPFFIKNRKMMGIIDYKSFHSCGLIQIVVKNLDANGICEKLNASTSRSKSILESSGGQLPNDLNRRL